MGKVVTAEDDDRDMLTYTLGGADADMFRVRSNGQIEVSKKAKLNYEDDTSHTVTLTATDSSGASNNTATITVTIHVTDVDEKPEIMKVEPGQGLTIAGRSSRSYAENGTGSVAAYTATGAVGSVTWTLGGDDMDDFNISTSGRLTFMEARRTTRCPMDMRTRTMCTW